MLYYAAIVLISAATILLELALLRLFAVQQFYHFAFMVISLALLGAGASGSILSIWRRRFSPAALCLAFGIATVGAYLTINYLPFDSFSIAWDSRQLLFLAIYFLAVAVPFLFAGLLIGGELMSAGAGEPGQRGRPGSHQIYGANLIGSALWVACCQPAIPFRPRSAKAPWSWPCCYSALISTLSLIQLSRSAARYGRRSVHWLATTFRGRRLDSSYLAGLAARPATTGIASSNGCPRTRHSRCLSQAFDARHTCHRRPGTPPHG